MTGTRAALILSAQLAGGVRVISADLHERGWRTILVSEFAADPNAGACDEHVVVDWADATESIAGTITAAGLRPDAIVTMVESLIAVRAELLDRLRLADSARELPSLMDKAAVRRAADRAGVFSLWWVAGTISELAADPPHRYPSVLKPAQESGASRDVHLLRSPADWNWALTDLAKEHTDDLFMVEQFLDGDEFSVDGYVTGGSFTPVFVADKPDHDASRLHDRGLRISPPVRLPAAAVDRFVADLRTLITHIGLDGVWLHVEGRVREDGRPGLIEINPRPGGGLYAAAIRFRAGLDPIAVALSLAIGEQPPTTHPGREDPLALVPVAADALGRVECSTTAAALRGLPGVIDAYVINGYRVTTLDKENFFAAVAVTGRDEAELRARAAAAVAAIDFQVIPDENVSARRS